MPRSVDQWWARRKWATGQATPYPVGRFRDAWAPFVRLVAQYRPEKNHDLLLSQIPPAAEVYLVWVCAIGHEFVATPAEQRGRPGARRARGDWCPVCAMPSDAPPTPSRFPRPVAPTAAATPGTPPAAARRVSRPRPDPVARPRPIEPAPARRGRAFHSAAASAATSAAQERLRALIAERLDVDVTRNAITVGQQFHGRSEVWPDVVLDEFAIAIEYDTVGRAGDEHVGRRERSDRRKDALLRAAGWEVIRLRHKPLRPLGPHDLVVASVSAATVDRLVERIAGIRGELFVAAYRREANPRPTG